MYSDADQLKTACSTFICSRIKLVIYYLFLYRAIFNFMFQIPHVSILIKGNLECDPTQKEMTDLQLQLTLLPKCTANLHTIEARNLWNLKFTKK